MLVLNDVRERLSADTSFTYLQVFEALAPLITPEEALQRYRRKSLRGDQRVAIANVDQAMLSGRRDIINQALRTAKEAKVLGVTGRGDQRRYKLLRTRVERHASGIQIEDLRAWLKKQPQTLEDLVAKALEVADYQGVLESHDAQQLAVADNGERYRAAVRSRVLRLLRDLRKQGVLREEKVPARVEFGLRKYPQGKEPPT